MTDAQRSAFGALLASLEVTVLTHGDCVGADAQAHELALAAGARARLRPCDLKDSRAFCAGGELIAAPARPLARNRKIVDDGALLIATPGMMKEQRRSGVWATIRYARKRGRRILIIWPDGRVDEEPGRERETS